MTKHGSLGVEGQGAYRRLSDAVAIRNRPLAVVVGAGASSPSVASWTALYERLREELEEQAFRSDEALNRLEPALESLGKSNDMWERFDVVSKAIPTEYRNIIRNSLSVSQDGPIPDIYTAIWNLPIDGMVSLNLDTYARRAGSLKAAGSEFKIEQGVNAGRIQRLLLTPHRFLYELHGTIDDEQSWVLTKSDLEGLYARPGYRQFLGTLYSQFTVVFLGISADDIAIGSPLTHLAMQGVEGPEHFWITDRSDTRAIQWAQAAGVERVEYPEGAHDTLVPLLRQLAVAVAQEPVAAPVRMKSVAPNRSISDPDELARKSTGEIRLALNGYAEALLSDDRIQDFEQFVLRYDELIDRAWYIPPTSTGYQLFDYTLSGPAGKGAFGSVYRARTPEGDDVALKLLKREIRDNLPLLHSFRRGVAAMKIIADRSIEGMVTYRDASEIPTFVTMEWIEGPTVAEAKRAHLLNGWHDILEIIAKVCKIVIAAHGLPERVLHRDLRPANIMLRNGWDGSGSWDVVVLDFDLATYLHATSESVLAENSALGYLAPEQLVRVKGTSSRSSLVDSFGLGMTLFYLVSGVEPEAYMHRTSNFDDKVRQATRDPHGHAFHAVPNRVARLILNAVKDDQRNRWSLPQIKHEIDRLVNANLGGGHALDSDLVAEEIACRCAIIADGYVWTDNDTATYNVASGPKVAVHAFSSDVDVEARLSWADEGTHDRKSMRKFLPERLDRARASLARSGWHVEHQEFARQGTLDILARCPVTVDTDAARLGAGLNSAIETLTFS